MQNAPADAAVKLKHFRGRPSAYRGLPLSPPSSPHRRWLGMQLQSSSALSHSLHQHRLMDGNECRLQRASI